MIRLEEEGEEEEKDEREDEEGEEGRVEAAVEERIAPPHACKWERVKSPSAPSPLLNPNSMSRMGI